jgi:hypothetical protein
MLAGLLMRDDKWIIYAFYFKFSDFSIDNANFYKPSGDVGGCVDLVHQDGEISFLCIFVISWAIHTLLPYVIYNNDRRYFLQVG